MTQAFLEIPLSKYFQDYDDIDYLKACFGGYLKAFDEYHVFRLTHVLYQLRYRSGVTLNGETPHSVGQDNELEISILTEYYVVFLQVIMDQIAVFIPFYYNDLNKHNLLKPKISKKNQYRFKSFETIKHVFNDHRKLDDEFYKYLEIEMSWFESINTVRNDLIHGSGRLWLESGTNSKDIKFKNVSGYLMKNDWFPSLKDYIAKTYYEFRKFLLFL